MKSFLWVCFPLLVTALYSPVAHGTDGVSQHNNRLREFPLRPAVDIPVLALSAAIWMLPVFLDKELTSDICTPTCEPTAINKLDRTVIHYNSSGARIASDVLIVALPVSSAALSFLDLERFGKKAVLENIVLIAESIAVTGALNQIVKFAVARPRPYMYRGNEQDRIRYGDAGDYRSFFSNHTSMGFAATVSLAYLYSRRRREAGLKWLVWTAAIAGGASVASLRVAAGKHFYTDVVAGAIVGTSMGILVPALHETKPSAPVATSWYISPRHLGLSGTF